MAGPERREDAHAEEVPGVVLVAEPAVSVRGVVAVPQLDLWFAGEQVLPLPGGSAQLQGVGGAGDGT